MTGGDVGLGALAGGIGGAIGGAVGFKTLKWDLPGRVAAQVISGSVSGGIASVIHGGNFWQGMVWGAAGAAIASGIGAVIEIATRTERDYASGRSVGGRARIIRSVPENAEEFHMAPVLEAAGEAFDVDMKDWKTYLVKGLADEYGFEAVTLHNKKAILFDYDTIMDPHIGRANNWEEFLRLVGHELGHAIEGQRIPLYSLRYGFVTFFRGRSVLTNPYELRAEAVYGRAITARIMGRPVSEIPKLSVYAPGLR